MSTRKSKQSERRSVDVVRPVPPKRVRRKKTRIVQLTLIDRMTIFVMAHSRKEARNKIKTIADLNKYKREGGYVMHAYRNIAGYHLPLTMGN